MFGSFSKGGGGLANFVATELQAEGGGALAYGVATGEARAEVNLALKAEVWRLVETEIAAHVQQG